MTASTAISVIVVFGFFFSFSFFSLEAEGTINAEPLLSLQDDDATALNQQWKEFKQRFGKTYPSFEEETTRFNIFINNLKHLETLRPSASSSVQFGITKFFVSYSPFVGFLINQSSHFNRSGFDDGGMEAKILSSFGYPLLSRLSFYFSTLSSSLRALPLSPNTRTPLSLSLAYTLFLSLYPRSHNMQRNYLHPANLINFIIGRSRSCCTCK